MKKFLFISAATLCISFPSFAGDYLTNTNQNAAFLRMIARGASIDIDGVYSNPAGLSFLSHEGFYLSLTGQSAYQTREIDANFPLFKQADGTNGSRLYKGTASAPFIPSFQGLYKKDNWVISASFAITGGGGKASFSDWLSVFAGGRMNYFTGGYEGYLKTELKNDYTQIGQMMGLPDGKTLASIDLDCKQTGWGITPIIGADLKFNKLNIGLKYEFKANLNLENITEKMDLINVDRKYLADYEDGVNTPSDIPSMFSAAIGYEILPTLRASVEYHFFDDKHAGMANVTLPDGTSVAKQKTLKHGTHEYLAGMEWDITKRLTVSGGFQKTNYGLSNDFQTDTSFSCDSYSLGFGARVNLTQAWSIDVAYFWTHYNKYTKETDSYNGTGLKGTDIYNRTNKVFGLSLNYKF